MSPAAADRAYWRWRARACTPEGGSPTSKRTTALAVAPGRSASSRRACCRRPSSSASTLTPRAGVSPRLASSIRTSSRGGPAWTPPPLSRRTSADAEPVRIRNARRLLADDRDKRDPGALESLGHLLPLVLVGGVDRDRSHAGGVLQQGWELAGAFGLDGHLERARPRGLELVVHGLDVVVDALDLPPAGTGQRAAEVQAPEHHVHEAVELVSRRAEVEPHLRHLAVVGHVGAQGDRLVGHRAGRRLVVDHRRLGARQD